MKKIALVFSSVAVSANSDLQLACGHADLNIIDRIDKQCKFAADQLQAYEDNGVFSLDGQDCDLLNHGLHSNEKIQEFLKAKDMDSFCRDLDRGRGNRRRQDQREEEAGEPNPLDIVKAYGCFCSFGSNLGWGKGQPKNAMDELCRNSFWSYQCMRDTNPACVTGIVDTYYVATVRNSEWEIEHECDIYNRSLQEIHGWTAAQLECAKERCKIDSSFFLDIMDISMETGYSFDDQYVWQSAGGSFDKETGCINDGNHQREQAEYECCGDYPYRAPLNVRTWSCCKTNDNPKGNPYRPTFKTCCSDGTIGNLGSNC